MRGATARSNDLSTWSSFISIHAPMRGATVLPSGRAIILLNFNPRAHEGRDNIILGKLFAVYSNFNPRAHEGRDQKRSQKIFMDMYFNPRAHEGRDGN